MNRVSIEIDTSFSVISTNVNMRWIMVIGIVMIYSISTTFSNSHCQNQTSSNCGSCQYSNATYSNGCRTDNRYCSTDGRFYKSKFRNRKSKGGCSKPANETSDYTANKGVGKIAANANTTIENLSIILTPLYHVFSQVVNGCGANCGKTWDGLRDVLHFSGSSTIFG